MMVHKNFIFVHLTKTGGTFLREYLSKNVPQCQQKVKGRKVNRHNFLKNVPVDMRSKRYKWGVIRNPLDWYISLWGANITPIAIKNRARRKKWYQDHPALKRNPKKFIRFICEKEKGKIPPFFDFDLTRKMDIGVLTYRYLSMFYDHKIFQDPKWMKTHEKYRLIDEVIRVEDGLTNEVERIFKEKISPLSEKQLRKLYSFPKKNQSKHKPYIEYYNNQGIIDYVKHKDKFIFDLHYPEDKVHD